MNTDSNYDEKLPASRHPFYLCFIVANFAVICLSVLSLSLYPFDRPTNSFAVSRLEAEENDGATIIIQPVPSIARQRPPPRARFFTRKLGIKSPCDTRSRLTAWRTGGMCPDQ